MNPLEDLLKDTKFKGNLWEDIKLAWIIIFLLVSSCLVLLCLLPLAIIERIRYARLK